MPVDACLLLDCTSLKAACLHLLLTSIADLLPRSVQRSASVPRSEFGGVWSLLGDQFLHILPFLSLKNLLHFCFDFTLCPFTVRQDFSKINWFPWCTLWDMFLLSGVMFFVTCFFIARRRREKGEDLRLLYFSVVSLLFISTFTSCLSSLYHPNVLRSKLSALPFHVLHSGFAESTAHHIPINLMTRESCWGIYEPHQTLFVSLCCFDCLIFLHTRRMCSLHTRRTHTRWEELIDLLRPALINPEKNLISQSITTVNLQVHLVAAASGFFHKHGPRSLLNSPHLFTFIAACVDLLHVSATWWGWIGFLCVTAPSLTLCILLRSANLIKTAHWWKYQLPLGHV